METKRRSILVSLLKYTKGQLWLYFIGLMLMLFIVVCDLLVPIFTSMSLKYLGEEVINFDAILLLVIVGVIVMVIQSIARYAQTMILNYAGHRITLSIRDVVLCHIQSLSHEQLNNIPVGKLVTRVTSDVNVLWNMYTNVILSLITNAFTIIGVFIAMFILNDKLALILLIIVPVIAVFTYVFRYYSRRVHRVVRDNVSNMNAFLSENLSGMKIIQVFNQEEKKYQEFVDNNNQLKRSSLKEIFVFGIFRPSVYVLYITSVILVLWFGGNEAIEVNLGILTVGITYDVLYAFYQYVSRFFNPIQALADQFNELQSAFASAEKIFSILDIQPQIVDSEDAIDLELTGDIEFKDVWFSYIPGEWVLKGVSFHIKANQTVAFVGKTGSGKTTILSLIVRNYDIQKGQILIDGVDIKKIKISCLRKQFGQMLQDVFLFSGNVFNNIQMYDEKITIEDVMEACKYVNADRFISKLPNGYYEPVRERGNNFSLGQRQLISFARAIVHKPKIMILDEATANIDTESEVLIQDSLKKIMNNGTVLVVAHRLSTIQHADNIIVFHNGNIIEEGNHQSLLKQKGRYHKLYMLQFAKENKK